MPSPRLSIVTPSFRASTWLKLCIASVADQGVVAEHIVQDAGSDDGTLDWLGADGRVKAYVEKDSGMYDAVNRGLRKSSGEIVAYLNCDEQYLPGALTSVVDFFDRHPRTDVLFADCLVVDASGECLCYRKIEMPSKHHVMVSHLPTFTSSMFFRRRLLERGLFFDTQWRDLGDADWVLRVMKSGARLEILRQFISAFTDTGANMNLSPNAQREREKMFAAAPKWAQRLRPALVLRHRIRRWLHGAYRQKAFDYAIYTRQSPEARVTWRVKNPTFIWKSRLTWAS